MSLIKSVDVPKHMADRLRSRRIAARLSGGAAKQPVSGALMGAKDPLRLFPHRSAHRADWRLQGYRRMRISASPERLELWAHDLRATIFGSEAGAARAPSSPPKVRA